MHSNTQHRFNRWMTRLCRPHLPSLFFSFFFVIFNHNLFFPCICGWFVAVRSNPKHSVHCPDSQCIEGTSTGFYILLRSIRQQNYRLFFFIKKAVIMAQFHGNLRIERPCHVLDLDHHLMHSNKTTYSAQHC